MKNIFSCNNIGQYTVLLLGTLLLFSCEREIDIDLGSTEQRYVIEALLSDQIGDCKVLISQTKDFGEDNSRLTVSDASVSIRHGNNTVILHESAPGTYTDDSFVGVPGSTYYLTVQIGDETITSTSTMPPLVAMDSLYISDEFIGGEDRRLPTIDYTDPAGESNQYRFVLHINGTKKNQIFIRNDDLTDGNSNSTRLYVDEWDLEDGERIKSGDLIRVEMQTVEQAVYRYFFSLDNSATGNSNSASPANPVSNLQGNALGYFSAYTSQVKEVQVP